MTAQISEAVRNARTIAGRDATDSFRDGRFRWTSALLLMLLAGSIVTGSVQTRATARLHEQAQRTERDFSLDKGEMNPHAASHYGAFVFRPIEPLAALDPGVDPFVGVSMFLEAHAQQLDRHRPAEDATPVRRLGELSAALTLQWLVPLLIVVLTHATFAGEREDGTLRQLSAVGVGRGALAVGKVLGTTFPLACTLLPATLIGAFALVSVSSDIDGETISRVGWLAGSYLTYFGVWICAGLAVSARARGPRAALVVLCGCWCGAVLVAPPLVSAAMAYRAPAPTTAQLAVSLDEAKAALLRWDARVARVQERFLAGELPSGADVPSNPEVIALVDAEMDESAVYDEQFDRLFEAYDRQAESFQRMSVFSPALAIRDISMAMSGTGYDQYREFVASAARYRREFVQTLNAELSAYSGVKVFDYTRGRDLWEKIPEFSYTPPLTGDVLVAHATSSVALAIWLLVGLAGLGWAMATMPVD